MQYAIFYQELHLISSFPNIFSIPILVYFLGFSTYKCLSEIVTNFYTIVFLLFFFSTVFSK